MKIDFSILWVDDNKDFVESLRPQLNKWMEDHGLGLLIHWRSGEAGVYSDLSRHEVELIVLDYKLKGGKTGDAIISEIRDKGFFEDIIFYTTGAVPNNMFDIPPDGVFFVARGDAKDRIKDLIGVKIRRASDLATLRGWIVADAIELEGIMGRVLAKCFKDMEVLFRDRVLIEEGMFDFGKKHRVLSGILKDQITLLNSGMSKSATLPKLQACKKILDVFPKEIIEIRNALAHQMAEISATGHKKIKTKTKESKEIIITPEECVVIRKNVRKHFDNLLALEALV
ncbi:hypothetical protein [Prosthecobacter sp.]|uniref:hypothetical protein n=1 Tax=Prosthecobacter sp. TaxID=1965333 RepID=UPI00378466BE